MRDYQREFIRFMVQSEVLLFGDFTLKSGRRAPYFINTGKYRTGQEIAALGEFYAQCFMERGIDADLLVGPAYKGIPLAVTTAIALAKRGKDVGFCFDRKEEKDHGEGGMFVGKTPAAGDRVCIVEDVMTSGKALREILPKIGTEAKVAAMLISVDRMERGTGMKSAVREAKEEFGIDVYSIVTVEDIMRAMEEKVIPGAEHLPALRTYLRTYGA